MFSLRVPHAAPPGYAARIREELKPLIGVYPAGYGLVATDNTPLAVGTGITLVPGRDGMVVDATSTNTGLTRAYAVTDHPLTLVFGGRWDNSASVSMIASLATTADKLVRVSNHGGVLGAQHIGATTNATAATGAIAADGYFVSGVAVFASPTDARIYARGSAGQARGATTTNVGALGALTKAAFGIYDGSVAVSPMDGQIQYAQWLRVALTDAEAWALVDNPWGMFEPRRIMVPVSAGGGGQTVAIGQASETDLAQALASSQALAIGQAAETDLAQALSSGAVVAIGQAAETDLAQALQSNQALAIGQAAETDEAQALSSGAVVAIGQALETDSAQALTSAQAQAIGQALETDEAQAMAFVAPGIIGQAQETDEAQSLAGGHQLAIGQALEADTAQALTVIAGTSIGIALEIDTAGAFSSAHQRAIGQATETDLAQALTVGSAGGTASAAEVWGYTLSNGLTAEETLVAVHAWLSELHLIHGLTLGSPLSVTALARAAGAVSQAITDDGTTATVTRL